MDTLLVFSHLRWDFVYQRPQHLLSRMAGRWHVLYVEEPLFRDGAPTVETLEVQAGVTVVRMYSPVPQAGFHDDQLGRLQMLLAEVLQRLEIASYGVWFYTPMALPLLKSLTPRLVCYDCMDELSAFLNPPKQLVQRETALLKVANVVFTGGPSLFRRKDSQHPNVHCIPSSVDSEHFARGRDPLQAMPAMQKISRPRLGFYGVVDERFDSELLRGAAALRPDWQWIVVGPVVKIDAATLPRADNIHYFGQQPYEGLPGILAAWDVCLLPFARNEATRNISPTKTLEYLAADKPVVSTDVGDVRELYGEAVQFADTAEAWVEACAQALNESGAQQEARVATSRRLVAASSWDVAAAFIAAELQRADAAGLTPDMALLFQDRASPSQDTDANTSPPTRSAMA